VEQKLEHYAVDESRAEVLDTISVERGYTRRGSDHLHYVAAPDDLDAIVEKVGAFLQRTGDKRRLSVDSLTEMAYYADVSRTHDAAERMLALLDDHDAVGLFHLSKEVHDTATIDRFRRLFDGVVDLDTDGTVRYESN
jgi:KaiC/GvpD/RAD55 family RecA-like ATPase